MTFLPCILPCCIDNVATIYDRRFSDGVMHYDVQARTIMLSSSHT
jgi:hypothetical protein